MIDGRQPADDARFCGRAREKGKGGSRLGCLFAGEAGLGDYFCHKYWGEGGAKVEKKERLRGRVVMVEC